MAGTGKEKIKVVVYVNDWRIEGDLHVLADARLTDSLNARMKDFLAITDATIFDARTGEVVSKSAFVDVNRNSISIIHTID